MKLCPIVSGWVLLISGCAPLQPAVIVEPGVSFTLAPGHTAKFRLDCGGRRVHGFVVNHDGTYHAYVNSCPHVGTPLEWEPDEFMDRDGRHLVCSTHGALFRVEDGVCVAGPCQGDQLEPFPIALRDGVVFALDEFAGDFA